MNNTLLKVYVVGEDKFELFYKLDTANNSKVYSVERRNIAILIKKNGDRLFFRPKLFRSINFELGLLGNNSYLGLPLNSSLTLGDSHSKYSKTIRYSKAPGSFNLLPGAYLGHNYIIGSRKRLKFFLNPSLALVQSHFNYYSEQNTNFSAFYGDKRKEQQITNLEVRSLNLFINFNLGCHINIVRELELDMGIGFNAPLTVRNQVSGFKTYYFADPDNSIVLNDTITFDNKITYDKYIEEFSGSLLIKFSYHFKSHKNFGVFLAINAQFQSTNNPNWFSFGMKYYPFKNRR